MSSLSSSCKEPPVTTDIDCRKNKITRQPSNASRRRLRNEFALTKPISFLALFFGTVLLGVVSPLYAHSDYYSCGNSTVDCVHDPLLYFSCVGANGYLGQTNIASVINLRSDGNLGVELYYLDSSGMVQGYVADMLPPLLKRDYIINDLGLLPDTIGTVCVLTNAIGATDPFGRGNWAGGIAIYKPDLQSGGNVFGDAFEYALYYPFTNPEIGPTTLPVNTYHIGADPSSLVANWLSVSDAIAGDGLGLNGLLQFFDEAGNEVHRRYISLTDGGRADYAAHDALTGEAIKDVVGMAKFTPDFGPQSSGFYYMTLTRYFYDCPGASCNSFLTAFNIPRRPPTSGPLSGVLPTFLRGLTVIEVNNSEASGLNYYAALSEGSGVPAGFLSLSLNPFQTYHLLIDKVGTTGFISKGSMGGATLNAQSGEISSTSFSYLQNDNGKLELGFARALTGSAGIAQLLEFNTYINQVTSIALFNPTNAFRVARLAGIDSTGTVVCQDQDIVIGPRITRELSLYLPPDKYGTVVLEFDGPGVVAETYVFRLDATDYIIGPPSRPLASGRIAVGTSKISCITPPPAFNGVWFGTLALTTDTCGGRGASLEIGHTVLREGDDILVVAATGNSYRGTVTGYDSFRASFALPPATMAPGVVCEAAAFVEYSNITATSASVSEIANVRCGAPGEQFDCAVRYDGSVHH